MKKDVSKEAIAAYLEKNGYKREVAGNETFDKAVRCFELMFSTGKGCFIGGKCGVGKTLFCKIAANAFACDRFVRLGEPTHLNYFTSDDHFQNLKDGSVFLDDIGAERKLNEYGIIRETVGEFVTAYHSRWAGDTSTSVRLFANTNLTGDEFVSRYSQRVWSRICDLCVVWNMRGDDKRKVDVV